MSQETYSGVDKDLWEKLYRVGVSVHLADRFGLRISGADAERYLNGQVTNDVRLAESGRSVFACVTDAKGRLEGEAWIRRDSDGSFFLDGPLALEEALSARLSRYAIADDVLFEKAEVPAWHVMGGERSMGSLRFGLPGCEVEERPEGVDEVSAEEAECIRIAMGFPAWGRELVAGMLPPEAGIEALAISYDKGCYVGQEVISRVRRAGKVNRKLCYLVADDVADDVVAENPVGRVILSADGVSLGAVTSAVCHPRLDRWVALAYVDQRGSKGKVSKFFLEEDSSIASLSLSFTNEDAPYREAFADV